MSGGLRGAMRFAFGLSKGLRRGDFFPPQGRQPGLPAPGGSSEQPLPPSGHPAITGGLVLSHHKLALPGLSRPVTLMHLTDVHLKADPSWVDHLCQAVGAQRPDLVLLTGDVVTRGWDEGLARRFLDSLPNAPLGRLAVMGNWEHWAGADPTRWRKLLAEHDVQLLIDEVVDLGPLQLAGTDDQLAGSPDPAGLLQRLAPGRPTVVMSHSPAMFPELAQPGVHLVLSGHSHGGQVRVPGLGALWVPMGTGPYISGWYRRDRTHLFVSRGVGWSIAPVRLRCPPEVALITLEPG